MIVNFSLFWFFSLVYRKMIYRNAIKYGKLNQQTFVLIDCKF